MPGLFDGMRISTSGVNTHRVLQEVVAQNIANASNENYTRQTVRMDSLGTIFDGKHFLGQGVETAAIERVRDTLLDEQLRASATTAKAIETELQWLEKVEAVFNEPSDYGINQSMTNFWESWSELSVDPQSLATRSNVLEKAQTMSNLFNLTNERLEDLKQDTDQAITQMVGEINGLTQEIARLNEDIFEVEAGRGNQANDLRDKRDAAIDALSEKVKIQTREDSNGMMFVYIGTHPVVVGGHQEELTTKPNSLDSSQVDLFWQFGERFADPKDGELSALLKVRDEIITGYQSELDSIASSMIREINELYSNGVGLEGETLVESNLGYEALGVSSAQSALNLVETGKKGALYMSFYDSNKEIVRTQGVLIDATDSLEDIAQKLDGIKGVSASLISDSKGEGRLQVALDANSSENVLGETSFSFSNNPGGFDTSGFLDLLQFHQTDKSTNTSAAQPTLTSRDLSELQTVLGEPSITAVRSKALNLAGSFSINLFETATEDSPKTNGHLLEQFTIQIESSDSIDSIMTKINTLTAEYGLSVSVNGSNQLELTSSAQTDSNGDISGTGNYLRLSFSNKYSHPQVANDEPPENYSTLADSSHLLAKLEMNTLFQGSSAGSMQVDERIQRADQIHASYKLKGGDNSLAISMHDIQRAKVAVEGQFTIAEQYGNMISTIGSDVKKAEGLQSNEALMLESFKTEKNRISGVNLDEELAKMIEFQRSYEANARMLSTFNQMAQEVLNLSR